EYLEPVVRRVHREQARLVGRERERSHLTTLELDERGCPGSRYKGDGDQGGDHAGTWEHEVSFSRYRWDRSMVVPGRPWGNGSPVRSAMALRVDRPVPTRPLTRTTSRRSWPP